MRVRGTENAFACRRKVQDAKDRESGVLRALGVHQIFFSRVAGAVRFCWCGCCSRRRRRRSPRRSRERRRLRSRAGWFGARDRCDGGQGAKPRQSAEALRCGRDAEKLSCGWDWGKPARGSQLQLTTTGPRVTGGAEKQGHAAPSPATQDRDTSWQSLSTASRHHLVEPLPAGPAAQGPKLFLGAAAGAIRGQATRRHSALGRRKGTVASKHQVLQLHHQNPYASVPGGAVPQTAVVPMRRCDRKRGTWLRLAPTTPYCTASGRRVAGPAVSSVYIYMYTRLCRTVTYLPVNSWTPRRIYRRIWQSGLLSSLASAGPSNTQRKGAARPHTHW